MKEVFTTAKAARICGMSKQKVANLFDEGKIGGYRIPAPGGSQAGARRIPREALLEFMRANRIPTDALEQHEQSARKKLLIVEDDRFSLELIEAIFREEAEAGRLEIHSAGSGAHAAVLAGSLAPDCVILDLALPDVDGDAVFRAIRKVPALSRTRVVVVTAFADDTTRRRLMTMGADDFLGKPIEPAKLRAVVRRVLGLGADG